MRHFAFAVSVLALLTGPALAQQETLIQKTDGAYTTVRSDESGTTTIDEKEGPKDVPISPQEKAHWEKVFEFTGQGGKVISHQTSTAQ